MIRKGSILSVLMALMAVSCMQDKIIDRQHDAPIAFRTVMDRHTRATGYTSSNLTSFNVTALSEDASVYMDGVDFGTADYAKWSSAQNYYWPSHGDLDFYAYAPKATGGNGITFNDYKTLTVTPLADTDSQVDLLFACSTGNLVKDGIGGKMLNFRHAMSKVQVKVSNSNPNLRVRVEGWRLAGLDGTATFTHDGSYTDAAGTLDRALWSDNDDASGQGVSYTRILTDDLQLDGVVTPAQGMVLEGSAIIIPQITVRSLSYASGQVGAPLSGSYIALRLSMENITDGAPYVTSAWCCWPVGFDLEPGHRYVFSIDLAEGGYYETSPSGNTDPAAVLKDLKISFASANVDSWSNP